VKARVRVSPCMWPWQLAYHFHAAIPASSLCSQGRGTGAAGRAGGPCGRPRGRAGGGARGARAAGGAPSVRSSCSGRGGAGGRRGAVPAARGARRAAGGEGSGLGPCGSARGGRDAEDHSPLLRPAHGRLLLGVSHGGEAWWCVTSSSAYASRALQEALASASAARASAESGAGVRAAEAEAALSALLLRFDELMSAHEQLQVRAWGWAAPAAQEWAARTLLKQSRHEGLRVCARDMRCTARVCCRARPAHRPTRWRRCESGWRWRWRRAGPPSRAVSLARVRP
jgi:hypothetical protein